MSGRRSRRASSYPLASSRVTLNRFRSNRPAARYFRVDRGKTYLSPASVCVTASTGRCPSGLSSMDVTPPSGPVVTFTLSPVMRVIVRADAADDSDNAGTAAVAAPAGGTAADAARTMLDTASTRTCRNASDKRAPMGQK
ncbi:hypothetical protein GCM10020220_054760 [Nonomuraea rubra]